jgi:hypothetical protein
VNSLRIFIASAITLAVALVSQLSIRVVPAKPPAGKNLPALTANAIEIRGGSGRIAQLWLRATADSRAQPSTDADRVNFGALGIGTALGVIRFHRPWRDYRDNEVPPGTYVLRYGIQPHLKDHAGTTRYRDFALLDPSPSGRHPFVMALVPPASPPGPPHLEGGVVDADVAGLRVGFTIDGTGHVEP